MITIRKSEDRGHAEHGWLDSRHTFSFADYHDPEHMGFRSLRVINEDRVQPGAGFPTHPHRDMEIVTYVLDGALEHEDSMGSGSVIRPGDVQRMTAGTGVTHSEYNHSETEPVHLLQIWLLPAAPNLPPGYEQKTFPESEKRGRLRLIASRDGREGSVVVNQDADLYAAVLSRGETVRHVLRPGRHAWIQIVRGDVTVNGERLSAGDGASVSGEPAIEISGADREAEILLFDLP
ncbi:MAG: pirin family protein [Candidatus Binatia bacterium]